MRLNRRFRTGALAGLLVLMVGGCATTPPPQLQHLPWQERAGLLAALERWQLQGRLAIRTDDNRSWSVKLNWRQNRQQFDIHLSSPTGFGGALRLSGDDRHAVMELPDEPPQVAPHAEALLEAKLGWMVPVSGLKYWIVGRPDPAAQMRRELDEGGRLRRLEQAGWVISYKRYAVVDGLELPSKVELVNHHLKVKMVIDDWVLERNDNV